MGCTQSKERIDDLEKQLAAEKELSEAYRTSARKFQQQVQQLQVVVRNRLERLRQTFELDENAALLERQASEGVTNEPIDPTDRARAFNRFTEAVLGVQVELIQRLSACESLIEDELEQVKAERDDSLAVQRRLNDSVERMTAAVGDLQDYMTHSIQTYYVELKTAADSGNLYLWNTSFSAWNGVWRVVAALRDMEVQRERAAIINDRPVTEIKNGSLNRNIEQILALLSSIDPQCPTRADFFTGEDVEKKQQYRDVLNLVWVQSICLQSQPDISKEAARRLLAIIGQYARVGEECLKERGDSILFQAVADIHTGRTKHPTGRQGFSLLAAGAEIYTFLMELSKKSRVAELCDVGALAVTHIVEPFKAALKARLPAVGSPATTEAWAKSIVETYEWVNDRRTKEGGIAQLGAKPAEFGKLLNEAVDELFSQVKSMRTVKDIRDAIWSMGKDEVLQLPPFQRLEGVDLRVIADQWDAASAAKHTMASSDGPTPCEETAEAQERLAQRVERVAEQMHAGVDRFMVRGLVTAASAATVRAELKQAAQDIAAVAMANPRDVEAQLSLIAMACVIASWCMTPTSGVRDLVKMDDVSEREKGLLLVPHRLQLAAVLRVFGLHTASEADFLADALAGSTNVAAHLAAFRHNHLVEVGTGQGKSLILGVIGIAAGLVGIDVDIVCFNRLLSRRDRAAMSGFDCGVAGVDCGISYFLEAKAPRYLTFTELAKENCLIPRQQVQTVLGSAPTSPNATKQVASTARKRLILVDEVDAFFEIANQPYAAAVDVSLPNPEWWHPIADMYRFLSNPNLMDKASHKAALKARILERLPRWGDNGAFAEMLVEELVTNALRCSDEVAAADPSETFKHTFSSESEIGIVDESDFFDPNFRDTYIAPFLYWRETSRVGGALSESKCGELKKAVHSLRVALPPVTYSWLLKHCYMGMIGLSGTLRTLPASLLDYMQQPHLLGPIKKWTFVPPVHLLQQHTTISGGNSNGSSNNGVGMVQRATQVPWTQVHSSQVMCTSFKPAVALYDHTQDCAPYVERIMRSADPEAEWSATITDAIRSHRSLTRAVVGGGQVLVVFDDAARLQQYTESTSGVDLLRSLNDQLVILSQGLSREQVEERVANAMKPRTVTLMTRSYGRGTDFKAGKRDVVLVVQTFVSRTVSDEIQIRGRTARADRAGRCLLIFSPTHLSSINIAQSRAVELTRNDLKNASASHVLFAAHRDSIARSTVAEIGSFETSLNASSHDNSLLWTPLPTLEVFRLLERYNGPPPVIDVANVTVDFVIDVTLSMRTQFDNKSPDRRIDAVMRALEFIYVSKLHKLPTLKWNLITFGSCSAHRYPKGGAATFGDAAFTPRDALEQHFKVVGLDRGGDTFFRPVAEEMTALIKQTPGTEKHYVFFFTDGAPSDNMNVIPYDYESTLFAPMRNMYSSLDGRLAHFQVVAFASEFHPWQEDALRGFAQSWHGQSMFSRHAHEISAEFVRFGDTVVRRSAVRGGN